MKWIQLALPLALLCVTLTSYQPNPPSTEPCTKPQITIDFTWNKGIVVTMNHCQVRDILAASASIAGISTLIAEDCIVLVCKLAAAGAAAFIVAQIVELQDADNQCGNQGAAIEIASFADQAAWKVIPTCDQQSTTTG